MESSVDAHLLNGRLIQGFEFVALRQEVCLFPNAVNPVRYGLPNFVIHPPKSQAIAGSSAGSIAMRKLGKGILTKVAALSEETWRPAGLRPSSHSSFCR